MARFRRLEVLNEILRIGLVPVFHRSDVDIARRIVAACADGGARVVEFTNRGDNAYRVFSELVAHFAQADPDVILGVGSVVDPATAALYIASGANLVVGPVLNPEVARVCNRHKVAYVPGCATPSEISAAEELGVEIVKLFPGKLLGGPDFVKAILGPMPWTRLMPTGGVTPDKESITAWFEAGVAAVGMGSRLIGRGLATDEDFERLTRQVAQAIGWIEAMR
jgi:2-dehydro-3-deoxyphosphogluconate aldolase/(4S)-4-hydroxy-2-oxoglutarate aldolase